MTAPIFTPVSLPGADVSFASAFLHADEADAALAELSSNIAWEQHRIRLYGREHLTPRLCCWIGDAGASYTYSRTRFAPQPWSRQLLALREQCEHALGTRFNSVLANLYRDGRDAMGWHADDERELGPQPVIASLSLGATRRFLLRSKPPGDSRVELGLVHGSLLLMRGDTQRNYRHAVPRTAKPCGPRINLTFRWISTPTQ